MTQGPIGPQADSVPEVCVSFYGVIFPLAAFLVAGRVGGVGRTVDNSRFVVQNHQSTNDSGNPSGAGEDRYNQERATALVHYSQWREDDR